MTLSAHDKNVAPVHYLVSAALAAFAMVVLVTLDRLKYPIVAFLDSGGDLQSLVFDVWTWLSPTDFVVATIAMGLGLAVVVAEVRSAAVSRSLLLLEGTSGTILAVVVIGWFAHCFLHPGYLLGGDTNSHVARINHFHAGLVQGEFPIWDNFFNLGVPFLQFTGPLFHWTGGVVMFLTRDPYIATKIVLFSLHMCAGLATFALLKRLQLKPFAALIGAIGYSGSFAQLHLFMYGGDLPQAYTLALLPLGFLLVERVASDNRHVTVTWSVLAILGCLLLVNHPSNGLMIGIFLIFLIIGSVVFGRYPPKSIVPVATAGVVGIAMSAFIVVPVLVEQDWVTMTRTDRLLFLTWPNAEYLERLLLWTNQNDEPANFDSYLGVTLVAAAIVGFISIVRNTGVPSRRFFLLVACLLVIAIVLRGPHVRAIIFLLFFVSLLAAAGVHHLTSSPPRHRSLPAAIALLVFLDLGSSAIQPLARLDKTHFDEVASYLTEHGITSRTVMSRSYHGGFDIAMWNAGPLLVHVVPTLGIPYAYSVTKFHNYGAVVIKEAERDLLSLGRLTGRTATWLAMLNVKRLVNDTGRQMDMPAFVTDTITEAPFGRHVWIENAAPFLFAPELATRAPDANLDRPVFGDWSYYGEDPRWSSARKFLIDTLESMAYDPSTGTASVIPIRGRYEQSSIARGTTAEVATVKLNDYEINISNVRVVLETSQSGFVQLSHAWYPEQRVLRNGSPVRGLQGSLNFLVVPVVKGINDIYIEPTLSDTRRLTLLLSFLVFLGTAILGLVGVMRARMKPGQTNVRRMKKISND